MSEKKFIPDSQSVQEPKESELRVKKLSINDFARDIGLEPDAQGRYTFGPEHVQLAYEYAQNYARETGAEAVVIDGIASPAVIASLLHGVHPAEGYLTYVHKDPEKGTTQKEVKILEPIPEGEGRGPEVLTWVKEETDDYTLVEFKLSGNFDVKDLEKVIPPAVNPEKPVIISGRGPGFLTQTIAAAYRHYQNVPAVAFYQPASKFGPAKTEIGISHDERFPLGLNFGEPKEIGSAQREYEKRVAENLASLKEAIERGEVVSAEVDEKRFTINLKNGESYTVYVRDIRKSESKEE